MNELEPFIQQARVFITQHVSPDTLDRTIPLAAIVLVVGIGLSVLGAKLARPALTAALGLLGAWGGAMFAREGGYPGPIGALVGALVFATITHLTFRIWVGVATALVLSSLALGTFGYHQVAPYAQDFNGIVAWTPVAGATDLSVVPAPEEQAYDQQSPGEWAAQFWAFVRERDTTVERNGRLVGIGTFVTGLFLGVIAVRWMLILSASLVGTLFVTSGVATLFSQLVPDFYQAFIEHPGVVGMGVGGFLVTSLILQTLLTRKAPAGDEKHTSKT